MLLRGVRLMSYKITYGSTPSKNRTNRGGYLRYIPIVILAVILFASMLFPAELRAFRRHALPFLEPEVAAAFSQMLDSIHAGTDIGEACAGFYKEILLEEQTAD